MSNQPPNEELIPWSYQQASPDGSGPPTHAPVEPPSDSTPTRLFSITRTGILLLLVGHLLACIAALVLTPGGWPSTSERFIGTRVLPIVIGVLLFFAIAKPKRFNLDCLALAFLLNLWITAAGLSVVLFPVSGWRLAVGEAFVAFVLFLGTKKAMRPGISGGAFAAACFLGCATAAIPVRLLHADPPSTHPAAIAFEKIATGSAERRTLALNQTFSLDPTQAAVTVSAGRRYVMIEPVLTFLQRSPDECWTIFADRDHRMPPRRILRTTEATSEMIAATYIDVAHSHAAMDRLVLRRENDLAAAIEATSDVKQTVWSHLNTFTQLTIAGHRDLRLRFSPAPTAPIKVMHAGYPFGTPARFAYVDRDRVFHIVEATSAEKGPFRELAAGPVGEALTITLLDGDEEFLSLRFDDWIAQASTEPSPTAGWGVPQNAIEFGLLSEDAKSSATIFLSLASTSIGRGWDSVGHAAGVYRNRMTVTLPPR